MSNEEDLDRIEKIYFSQNLQPPKKRIKRLVLHLKKQGWEYPAIAKVLIENNLRPPSARTAYAWVKADIKEKTCESVGTCNQNQPITSESIKPANTTFLPAPKKDDNNGPDLSDREVAEEMRAYLRKGQPIPKEIKAKYGF